MRFDIRSQFEARRRARSRFTARNLAMFGIWIAALVAAGFAAYWARAAFLSKGGQKGHSGGADTAQGAGNAGGEAKPEPGAGANPKPGAQANAEPAQGPAKAQKPAGVYPSPFTDAKPMDQSDKSSDPNPSQGGAHHEGRPQAKNPEPRGGGKKGFEHHGLPVVKERKQWRERSWRAIYFIALGLGVLLFVFPWLLGYRTSQGASLASIILGGIVAITAVVGILLRGHGTWEFWIIGMAGILILVAPFVIGFEARTAGLWAFIILGALITLAAGSEAFDIRVDFP